MYGTFNGITFQFITYYFFRAVINTTKLSIAYSPTSPELEDVVRTAMSRLLVRNVNVIVRNAPDLLPENILEIISTNSTAAVELIKGLITVQGYDHSNQLGSIYALEETTRQVIAAVQFDDNLYGKISFLYQIVIGIKI